jgi:DNA-directed RNA polymerase subunit M/transcription elongation factor TFIIS
MSMAPFRINGKNALKTVLTQEKNIDTIEKYVYQISCKNDSELEENYNGNLYQIIGDIINEVKLKTILENIKNNKLSWNHQSFDEMNICVAEQNDFIKNPFEVEEGVFQCKQCGSKRVYSYTKQDRSCDEGTSVYAQCVACKAKWRERG